MPNYKHPAFVRVDDAQQRKELIEWLYSIGYKIDKWVDSNNDKWKYILAFDGIVQTEWEDPFMDNNCGTSIPLFKSIVAINNENDYMQFFIDERDSSMNFSSDYDIGLSALVYRKATPEELIEHFKNK